MRNHWIRCAKTGDPNIDDDTWNPVPRGSNTPGPPATSIPTFLLQIRGGKTRTVNDDEKVLLQCSVFGFSPLLDNTTQATSGESMIDWKISVVWFILVSDCLLLLVCLSCFIHVA